MRQMVGLSGAVAPNYGAAAGLDCPWRGSALRCPSPCAAKYELGGHSLKEKIPKCRTSRCAAAKHFPHRHLPPRKSPSTVVPRDWPMMSFIMADAVAVSTLCLSVLQIVGRRMEPKASTRPKRQLARMGANV